MSNISRTAVITGVSLFLETCGFYLLFGMLGNVLGQPEAALAFWLVLLALLWAFLLSLYVQTLRFTANLRGMLGLGVSVASFLFLIALDSGLSLAPLGAVVGGSAESAFELALTVGFLVLLWWRGGSIARGQVTVDGVRGSFQLAVVVLFAAVLVDSIGSFHVVNGFLVVSLFAVGLSGLALARFSSETGDSQLMSLDWWIPIGVSVAAVLLLGLLVAGLGLGGLDDVARSILAVMGEMGSWIAQPIIFVLGVLAGLLANLVEWISGMFGGGDISSFDRAVGRIEQFQEEMRRQAGDSGPPQLLINIIKWLAFLTGASLAGWVVYRLFRLRGGERSSGLVEETRESLFSWSKANQDLSAMVSEWWRNLAGARGKGKGPAREPNTPREFYHGLLFLAEGLGQPRREWQTPKEHQWDLQGLLPATAVTGIVDGFQQTHYGQVEADPQAIDSLRRDWQAIKQFLADRERDQRAQDRTPK